MTFHSHHLVSRGAFKQVWGSVLPICEANLAEGHAWLRFHAAPCSCSCNASNPTRTWGHNEGRSADTTPQLPISTSKSFVVSIFECLEHQLLTLSPLLSTGHRRKTLHVAQRVEERSGIKCLYMINFTFSGCRQLIWSWRSIVSSQLSFTQVPRTHFNRTANLTSALVHPHLLIPSNSTSASQISGTLLRAYFRLASRCALLQR